MLFQDVYTKRKVRTTSTGTVSFYEPCTASLPTLKLRKDSEREYISIEAFETCDLTLLSPSSAVKPIVEQIIEYYTAYPLEQSVCTKCCEESYVVTGMCASCRRVEYQESGQAYFTQVQMPLWYLEHVTVTGETTVTLVSVTYELIRRSDTEFVLTSIH